MVAGVRLRVTWISDKGKSMGVWRLLEVPGECTLSTLGAILNATFETETADMGTFFLPGEGVMFLEWGHADGQDSKDVPDNIYLAQRSYLQDLLKIVNRWGWLVETGRGLHMYAIIDDGALPPLKYPKVVGGAGVAPPYERKMKRKKKALPVDLMNHFLATRFALNPKKVERRTCEEMFTDFSLQKIGVGGKRAKNAKTLENLRTESPITDETLAAMLANYEKEDLLEVAEGKGLEILPGRRLQDIAAEVADYMLDEKVLKAVLYVLADEEMEALKTLLKGKLPRLDENPFHILYITAYVSENMNGDPQIAMDVAEKVRKVLPYINDDERRRRAWFYASLQTAGGLYVNFPINVLSDYMERGGYRPMTLKEIKALFEKIPLETRCGKVGHNGKFWCDLFEIEEWDALIPLDKKPYYIPTKEEIREGAFSPIFAPNFYEEELVSFFQDILGFGTEEAHQLWTKLSWVFFSGCDVNFALEILQEEGYTERLPKNKEGDLRHILARIQGQTRALTLKGFTPGEISRRREKEREDRAIARGRVPQKVISLQERQKMKQKRIQARKGNIE